MMNGPQEVGQTRSTDEAREQSRSNRRRRGWSEGVWPKGSRRGKTRTGHRTGQTCKVRWGGYGKQQ